MFVQKLCGRQFCYNTSTTLFYSYSNFISLKFSDSVVITFLNGSITMCSEHNIT